jgi:hypothetical protein
LFTNGLHNLQRVHEIVRVTVMKYWYDVDWPKPHDLDTVLAEYSLDVPFRVQWSVGAEIVEGSLARPCLPEIYEFPMKTLRA